MIVPKFLFNLNRMVAVGQRRVFVTRKDLKMFFNTSILSGDFLLADGSYSASTVYQQEKGIFIGDSGKYIEISTLSVDKIDRIKAYEWCGKNMRLLPTLADLQAIDADVVKAINNSLRQIGREDAVFSDDVATEFWSQETLENQEGITNRRVLLIKQADNLNKWQFAGLDGQVKILKAFLPDVILVSLNDGDNLWVLQQVAPDYYYILESQVQPAPKGNIHLEGPCLVIENSFGDSYCENGVCFVNTHKDYFRRINCGLYAKVGENNDRWQVVPQ